MPDLSQFILYIAAALALAVTPGPGIFYVAARTLAGGRAEGVASSFGTGLGGMVHVVAGSLGVSAIVLASADLFTVLKLVGAAYLVWMGIRTLLAKDIDPQAPAMPPEKLRRVFRDGFVVNLFNPKTAIFFLAFLPQFVDPARGAVHWQILVLGLTFMGLGMISDAMFALAAGAAGDFLRRSRRFLRLQRWFAGISFIGLGVTAALATRK